MLNSGLQNNSYSSRHSAPHQERPEIRRNAGLDWKGFAERIWSLFARVKGIRWTSWGTQSGEPLFFLCGRFAFNTFWNLFRRIAFFIFPIFNNCHTLILYSYLRLATNSLDAPVLVSSFCLFALVSWWYRCYLLFFLSSLYFWYFISRNELHFINLCRSRLERSSRFPVGEIFFLFFAHEKGLGHMFQKWLSCSPILFFLRRTSQK